MDAVGQKKKISLGKTSCAHPFGADKTVESVCIYFSAFSVIEVFGMNQVIV